MGTRADFYVGVGDKAEWLGSVAWDGYEWDEDEDCELMKATTEQQFRDALSKILKGRDDATFPEDGWPWPWNDSTTTDYAYYFLDGKVSCDERDDYPNMDDKKKVAHGKRSGIILISAREREKSCEK
jgi:hypothetical protein